jgi:uncharacterized damage-inducible protein DinB
MNAMDVLKYGNRTVLLSVEGLAEEDWLTPGVCGVWSVKDIIAHLASFEHLLVDVLDSILHNADTPHLDQWLTSEAFNDEQVAARSAKSVAEVLDEYTETHARNMELIAQVPEETLRQAGILPRYGREYDLEDFIVYSFYGHKREHTAQIDVFRDRIGR